MCDNSCAVISLFLREYYDAKIQMLSGSLGNQLLKCRGTSKYKFSYFQKHALRSFKAARNAPKLA